MTLTLAAPSYALLQADTTCWKCGESTRVTTIQSGWMDWIAERLMV